LTHVTESDNITNSSEQDTNKLDGTPQSAYTSAEDRFIPLFPWHNGAAISQIAGNTDWGKLGEGVS